MEKKILLHTENTSIGYANKKGVQIISSDINLSLEAGKLIALVGANGIGKSTLLRTIIGIQKPLSGTVLLNGTEIQKQTPSELSKALSVVLTEKLPPSNLTVFDLVALGRQPYTNWLGTLSEADHSKIISALELTQILHLSDKKHYEISDGQLQKVLIARALAQDTPLIILDEPTTHLDLLHKVALYKLLKNLTRDTGNCILFSTHDIDMAIQLSDEIIVMAAGQVIQEMPCQHILNGTFDRLFADENIIFDAEKGKFIFKNL